MSTTAPNLWSYCSSLSSLCPKHVPVAKIYAELRWPTTRFTGRSVDHKLGCTQGLGPCADSVCHVVRQLSTWNEFLVFIGVELCEGPPGQLSLQCLHGMCGYTCSTARERHATILVHWLLTVHRCVTRVELAESVIPNFSTYLSLYCDALLRNVSIKFLKVSSCSRAVSRSLFNSVVSMRRLESLECDVLDLSSPGLKAFLNSNATLKELSLTKAISPTTPPAAVGYADHQTRRIAPLLRAFGPESALEEITLDFSSFEAKEVKSLLKALSLNATLRKVNVEKLSVSSARRLCDAIRETGTAGRVHFGFVDVRGMDLACLKESFAEFTKVSFSDTGCHGTRTTLECLTVLTTCTHLKVLNLDIRTVVCSAEASVLSAYLEQSHAIREFYMSFDISHRALQKVLQGMSKNKSLEKLRVAKMTLDEVSAAILASIVSDSETIWHFEYQASSRISCRFLLINLARCLVSNTSLVSLNVTEYPELMKYAAAAKNFVRRNLGLVECAAHFVVSTRSKHCAEAFERVASSARVVARVQELAGESSVDRAKLIRKASQWLLGTACFMKVTGVVKNDLSWDESVEYRERLESLNIDCWLHVRKFIKVRDVLHWTPPTFTRRRRRATLGARRFKRPRLQ
ncbi:hypothetical protein HPB52_020196 [Rhipicephalus sanguineus]|uniref:Nlr family card domain protein n=1 Tax=Rhipicephalus sanguineus TaxID=34632 RepID=A0A9D4TBI3_RHISA|nr:hypothetical protein HPB52_020196 [Rhipicephalus sanguineus]